MATKIGTYGLQDLLKLTSLTVTAFGTDRANAIIAEDLARHNSIVDDLVSAVADVTTERLLPWGGDGTGGEMDEVDEYARTSTQKPSQSIGTLGIPKRLYQLGVGFTQRYLNKQSPADLARRVLNAQERHLTSLEKALKRSMFKATNTTVYDTLEDQISIPVKAFINADSMVIPVGANRQTFNAATHTHYTANNGMTNAVVLALETHLLEHGKGKGLRLFINYADETAFRALTSFVPFSDPRFSQYPSTAYVTKRLQTPDEQLSPYSRDIGTFSNAIVSVRPWAIANYVAAGAMGESDKPLAFRSGLGGGGLRLAAENDAYPLIAQFSEAEFGFGVKQRDMMAFLDFSNVSPGVYVTPTI